MPAEQHAVAVPVTTMWTEPGAVRDIDATAVADSPDPAAWTASLGDDERRGLNGRALTQLLLGEPVQVVEQAGAWVRVVAPWQPSRLDPRGYPGWVRRAHLDTAPQAALREAVVTTDLARLTDPAGVEIGTASYGTILPVAAVAGASVSVHLPGGRAGRLNGAACAVRDVPLARDPGLVDAKVAVAEADKFRGLAYLWGGMSGYGLDCSGLVHITYRRLGAVVPRDALDQAEACHDVPGSEARLGDLLFFARPGKTVHHVGFALGDQERILHAPQTGGTVASEPLNADRRSTLLDLAGRFPSST